MSDLSTPSLAAIFRLSQTLTGHTDAVLNVAFNTAGTLLASASLDRTIKVWALG